MLINLIRRTMILNIVVEFGEFGGHSGVALRQAFDGQVVSFVVRQAEIVFGR